MAYKVLTVDYAQMAKLQETLQEAGQRFHELWKQIEGDVEELGQGPKPWKGPNHDAFVEYFEERSHDLWWYSDRGPNYTNHLERQAEWVGSALEIYKRLEADIESEVSAKLRQG